MTKNKKLRTLGACDGNWWNDMKTKIPKILVSFILLAYASSACANKQRVDSAHLKVSKNHSVGQFVPSDLKLYAGVLVSARIIPDLKKLLADARAAGLHLKVVSGYRSFDKQVRIFNYWVKRELQKDPTITQEEAEKRANVYSARPGYSEHQLGTVIDILSSENNFTFGLSGDLKYITWLESNAASYNFKISYPKNNPEYQYEPWHLRWYPPS